MTVERRIRTIKLAEDLKNNPSFASRIGAQVELIKKKEPERTCGQRPANKTNIKGGC